MDARPIATAAIRSVIIGALNAITAESNPTKLKIIRSINMPGSGKIQLIVR